MEGEATQPIFGTIAMRVFSPSANFPRPVNTRGRDAAAGHAQPWSCLPWLLVGRDAASWWLCCPTPYVPRGTYVPTLLERLHGVQLRRCGLIQSKKKPTKGVLPYAFQGCQTGHHQRLPVGLGSKAWVSSAAEIHGPGV